MAMKVEDHGNGMMVIGTTKVRKAARVLCDYVDNPQDYRFATPTFYEGRRAVWLTTGPGEVWDGAVDHTGKPIAR